MVANGWRLNRWLVAVLLISLGCRVATLAFNEIPPYESRRQKIAASVAEQRSFEYCNHYFPFCDADNDTTASVGPLPILLFVGVMDLVGDGFAIPIAVWHLLLGLATTFAVYRLVMLLFDDLAAALIGAFLWGTYPPMIAKFDLALEAEPLLTCLLCFGALALIRGWASGRAVFWLLAGVCFGLAVQTRTSFLYFPPLLILLLPLMSITATLRRGDGRAPSFSKALEVLRSESPRRLFQYGLMMLVFVLVVTPWTIRNHREFDALIPGATLNGYNLFRQNHILAKDDYVHYVSHPEVRRAQRRLIEEREDLSRRENEHEMDRIYRAEALRVIRAHPGRYLLLSAWRFLPLTTNHGVRKLTTVWKLVGLQNLVLFALAGAAVIRRRFPSAVLLPVVAIVAYYVFGHMLVAAKMRLLMPAMPFVIVLAADQLSWLGRRLARPA